MTDLKRTTQTNPGARTGKSTGDEAEQPGNRDAEFGARERATRGTNRDADPGGESKNQAHGHPREERGSSTD